jgi:hypothetical protein
MYIYSPFYSPYSAIDPYMKTNRQNNTSSEAYLQKPAHLPLVLHPLQQLFAKGSHATRETQQGSGVGLPVTGAVVGLCVGLLVGAVGEKVGDVVGDFVGVCVGLLVGGDVTGALDGDGVTGARVEDPQTMPSYEITTRAGFGDVLVSIDSNFTVRAFPVFSKLTMVYDPPRLSLARSSDSAYPVPSPDGTDVIITWLPPSTVPAFTPAFLLKLTKKSV